MTSALLVRASAYIDARRAEFELIPPDRRLALQRLAGFVSDRLAGRMPARLLFVCTHNSRRSHMAQVWARAAAFERGLPGVEAFSGGTEVSAFDPRAAAALTRTGLHLESQPAASNPVYRVSYAEGAPALEAFSKTIGDARNPSDAFCAVMTCSAADEACPVVPGAVERVALPYEDPKLADGRPNESGIYDARCAEICREMLYTFSLVEPR